MYFDLAKLASWNKRHAGLTVQPAIMRPHAALCLLYSIRIALLQMKVCGKLALSKSIDAILAGMSWCMSVSVAHFDNCSRSLLTISAMRIYEQWSPPPCSKAPSTDETLVFCCCV